MYMSGRSLFPLTIEMCSRISRQFNGKMRISFAGGAEFFNCDKLFAAGIWPITVATTILKPGGYNRLAPDGRKDGSCPIMPSAAPTPPPSATCPRPATPISTISSPSSPCPRARARTRSPSSTASLPPARAAARFIRISGVHGTRPPRSVRPGPEADHGERTRLPFLTGTICAHRCQNKCTRNFYEESVQIRDTKLVAAAHGYDALMASIRPTEKLPGKKAAIIGGGPTGIAAAYFLARGGVQTTIFEREAKARRRAALCDSRVPYLRRSHRQGRRAHGAPRRRGQVRRSGPERGRTQEDGLHPHPPGHRRMAGGRTGYPR